MKNKLAGAIGLLAAGILVLSGCGEGATPLPHDNQIHPEYDNAYVNELFYRNDLGTTAPDPCVIQITDEESTEYGYYYLYGTSDPTMGIRAYRNKDLTGKWEDVTPEKNFLAFHPAAGHYAYGKGAFWAPEVVYDSADGKYYMYYSGALENYGDNLQHRMIGVAVADEPYGPFLPATTDGLDASKTLFDNADMVARMEEMGLDVGRKPNGVDKLFNCIDASPYVAPDGAKYLYFVHEGTAYGLKSDIFAVEMETWTKPVMSTFKRLTRCGYYTVDGEFTDEDGSNVPNYEANNGVNEGPYMYERQQADGSWKYYLTFSINGYMDKSYSVVQAVGDTPMGPFRKLTEKEGGLLISTDWEKFDHVSGTGHHSFVTVDDEIYIVYHEHVARETGGLGPRDVAVDRVLWTKNGKGDEILYCNGPTWSLQPRIAKHSGYSNLAKEAQVKVSGGSNAEALTDGLLSIISGNDFVKEFETDKTATITLTFDDYREISAVMVYNSKVFEKSFIDIAKIEFDCKDGVGGVGTVVIEKLAFDWDFYKMATVNLMRPGGSAVAVFNPLMCKEIRITIEVPEERPEDLAIMDEDGYFIKQAAVAVSEIVVLGK